MREGAGLTAFVPGHVTGFFTVDRRGDPLSTGSRGAGLTLTHGIEVAVERADETSVQLNDEPLMPGPVLGVLEALGLEARVRATSPLPLGAGFGVSGGLALGTALAANQMADRGRSENDLLRLAHRAEVEAGTGLGDVVAQARGGVPIRLEPGAPPHGTVDGVPETARIEYRSFGQLDTETVITGETDALSAAGEAALDRLRERPTLGTFFGASQRFAREADLLVPSVASAIDAVHDAGGEACMAMLGETVVARGTGLSAAGYDASFCQVQPAGASVRMD